MKRTKANLSISNNQWEKLVDEFDKEIEKYGKIVARITRTGIIMWHDNVKRDVAQ